MPSLSTASTRESSMRLVGNADGTALARWNLRMFTRKTIGIGAFHELAGVSRGGRRRRRLFRKGHGTDDQHVDHNGSEEQECLLSLHVSLLFPLSQAVPPARSSTSSG